MNPNDIYIKKLKKAMGGYKAEDVKRFLIVMGDYVTTCFGQGRA